MHLLDEGHEAVVETLQLLLLVSADDLELVGDRSGLGQVHGGVRDHGGGEDAAGSRCPAVVGGGQRGRGAVGAVVAAAESRRLKAGRAAARNQTHASGAWRISEDLPVGAAGVNLAGVTHGSFNFALSHCYAQERDCEWILEVREGECGNVRACERDTVRCGAA